MNAEQIDSGKRVLILINDLNDALHDAILDGLVINLSVEDRPRYSPKTPIITASVMAPITLEDSHEPA